MHSLDAQPHILGTAIQSRGGVVEKRNGEFVFKLDLDQNFQQLKANPRISTLFATTNAKVKMLYFSIEITDVRGIGKSAGMDLLRFAINFLPAIIFKLSTLDASFSRSSLTILAQIQ